MAADASRRCQVVVSAFVAIGALQLQVPAGQREATLGVIKRGRLPGRRAVADRAVCREPGRRMIRIGRSVVVLHVARRARRARQVVVPVGVAIGALQLGMRAGQWKSDRTVIEVGRLPGGCAVAVLTSLRQSKGDVVGIGSLLEIGHVTTHTVRRRSLVPPVQVAGRAVQTGMSPRQSEAGHFQVIEGSAQPG